MSRLLMCISLFVALLFCAGPAVADELESLIEGFDAETPATDQEELDGLTSGFDSTEEGASSPPTGSNEGLEELLGGFTEDSQQVGEEAGDKQPLLPEWFSVQGSLSLQSTLNFAHSAPPPGTPDYRGLSMFRGHGELITEASFANWKARLGATAFYDGAYHLNGQRDLYSDVFLDEYETEIRLEEAYLHGSLADDLDLKFGRQIVVWGKSDNIRITDVLNPLDRRWPGMVDIRYLRLPVTMTRVDYFLGDWSISPILVHEPRADIFPVYNSEFYPFPQPAPPLVEPGWSWDSQQPALAMNGIFSGWDLSFYAAYVYPDVAYLVKEADSTVYRTRNRALMLGSAANIAMGNWLLKGEVAWWNGLEYSNTDEEKSRLDGLVGVEYTGFSETSISFEVANRHIFDYEAPLELLPDGQKEDWTQYALRFVKDFHNDTLHLTILVSSFGLLGADGGFERLQLDYDLTDHLTLMGGLVFYESGDFPGFREIGDNDRILFEIEYRF